MGLDMYAHARMNVPADCPWFGEGEDFDRLGGVATECTIETRPGLSEYFAYWRKHPDLHGWMERLAHERGFTGEFNCVWLRLTPQDLDRLEADMEAGLARTSGFFFGASTPEDEAYTRRFIKGARYAFKKGATIFYDSWW